MGKQVVDRAQIKAFLKVASVEKVEELLLELFETLEDALDTAVGSLLLSRWLHVAQFALWCVWLA